MEYKALHRENSVYTKDGKMFVEGYASVFNNVDSDGDVILKGAFASTINPEYRKSLQQNPIRFITEHDAHGDPLGVLVELEETDKGLWFKAKIDDTAVGRDAYKQFDSGSRDSFSIGYRVLKESTISFKTAVEKGYNVSGFDGASVNELLEIDLIEISAVKFAANSSARISKKGLKMDVVVGDTVLFTDFDGGQSGSDLYAGEVVEIIDGPVELESGVIEPEEGDRVLKVAITEELEDGSIGATGDVVYVLESLVVVSNEPESDVEAVTEEQASEDTEEDVEEKSKPAKPRVQFALKPKAAEESKHEAEKPSETSDLKEELESVKSAMKAMSESFKSVVSDMQKSHKNEVNAVKKQTIRNQATSVLLASKRAKGEVMTTGINKAFGKFGEHVKGKSVESVLNQRVSVKGGFFETKAAPIAVTADSSNLQSQNVDRRGILSTVEERPMLRDLMRVVRTDKGIISYIQESGAATAVADLAAGVSSGATTITVDNATSFYEGQEIFLEPEGSNKREKATIVDIDGETITLAEPLVENHANGATVSAKTFKFTPETEVKPAMNLDFQEKEAVVKTLAHWVPVTKQALDDIDMLRSYIEDRLIDGLKRTEERQILYGNGGSEELDGIANDAGIRDYKWSDGGECDTKLDALRRAITLASYSGLRPDVAVLSIDDWEDVELAKGQDGHYIYADVVSGTEQRRWGLRVFTSTVVPAGQAIVGAFSKGATLWDREDISIAVTDSHSDFFVRNMYAIRAEERIGLSIENPEAFVLVEFDEAPECPCCGDGNGGNEEEE